MARKESVIEIDDRFFLYVIDVFSNNVISHIAQIQKEWENRNIVFH